jgi:tight adherence protein C
MIRRSLADCLDLLVVCTEAGLGFDGALAKVVDRMSGPLSDEFRKVLQDMSVGRTRVEALRAMAARVGLPELISFVAAIHQADLLGVSIAHVLRVQADSLRTQRNLRARETAAKLPVKLLFPLVFFIFPAIFVVVLSPGAIQIIRALTGTGR